jgi:hypothetical protein
LENDDASTPTGVSAKVSQMFPCNLYLLPGSQYFVGTGAGELGK